MHNILKYTFAQSITADLPLLQCHSMAAFTQQVFYYHMRQNMDYDIIVIGAGPAGLIGAIAAARKGCRVLVCERGSSTGRKLLVSGGGRCNITNVTPLQTFSKLFGGHKAHFVAASLKQWGPKDIITFFENLGVPLSSPDAIHFFPTSNKASDPLAALLAEAQKVHVTIETNCEVAHLHFNNKDFAGITYGTTYVSGSACIIAAGGQGYAPLGGTTSGYKLAADCSYEIVVPVPGLVGLHTQEKWPASCAGVTLDWARIRIQTKTALPLITQSDGSLLFTHKGISGPCALDISASISRLVYNGTPVAIQCILQPELDNAAWNTSFESWQQHKGGSFLVTHLAKHLPQRLLEAIFTTYKIPLTLRCADVNRPTKTLLISLLCEGVPLHIHTLEGWDKAMVSSGGVSIDHLDSRTMAGKLHKGLYFAGEVIDCDGPCGGYNLTWAFSSGVVAGKSAGEFVQKQKDS